MLNDAKGRWILDQHQASDCEQALNYYDQQSQSTKTSVIDRTFIDNNERWIIDYKYSRPHDGESDICFIERQKASYTAQLNHYSQLYQKLDSKNVRCALYFPQTAVFIEVTGN